MRRIRDITDGLSNTVAVGERAWENNGVPYSASILWMQKGVIHWACSATAGDGGDGLDHGSNNITLGVPTAMAGGEYVMNPPNSLNTDCNRYVRHAFSSVHSGGAQFLMGDGAVRFISENIDAATRNGNLAPTQYRLYSRLLAVDDGQVVGDF